MKTYSMTPADAAKNKKWILVDADGVVLGRLASIVALRLKGKHKAAFTPHVDCGDNVIVINAEKVRLTGTKALNSVFHWHTGFPGGVKERTPQQLISSGHAERVIENAVRRMMKKDSPLARKQMTNLKVYKGADHPHAAQSPQTLDLAKLNPKNKRSA